MRFVIDARYVAERPTGIGAYVEALIQRLPGLAPDECFHLWTHPSRPAPVTGPNLSCVTVQAPSDGLRTLLCPGLLDRLGPDDVVHFPYSLLGWGLPCPAVVTVHDLMWLFRPHLVDGRPLIRRARQLFYQVGMRRALRSATRIIAVSEATAMEICRAEPAARERIRVTHNAPDPACRPHADAEEARAAAAGLIGSEAPFYLVVGRNEPYKAHHLAVRAFAESALAHEHLVLVQRESSGRDLPALIRELGIAGRVHWMPWLETSELVTLQQAARALLHPSLTEGFGIPVVEAMACGCPVIASSAPALVEVLDGAALHAPVGSAEGIAAAVRRLRDEGLRSELRARGLERARDFDWERTAAATLEVYREAAREARA
jgi:glycosyltransferase involved in cell wall biosynthesis